MDFPFLGSGELVEICDCTAEIASEGKRRLFAYTFTWIDIHQTGFILLGHLNPIIFCGVRSLSLGRKVPYLIVKNYERRVTPASGLDLTQEFCLQMKT